MMKRMLALLLAALLAVLSGCAAEGASAAAGAENRNLAAYEDAASLMIAGDYAGAAEAFGALSAYMDAPQMAIYCRGLACVQAGDYATAVQAFTALGDFKDSAVKAAWYTGVGAQTAAEAAKARGTLTALEAAEADFARAEEVYAGLLFLQEAPARLEHVRALKAEVTAALPALREAHRAAAVVYADEEHFFVLRDGKWGLMSVDGRMVLPCQWGSVRTVVDGLVVVYTDELSWVDMEPGWGVVDLSGNVIVPCTMADITISGDLIAARDAEKVRRYFHRDGTPADDDVPQGMWRQVAEGRFIVGYEEGWALTDGQGRVLYAAADFNTFPALSGEGTIWLSGKDGKIGLLSADGEVLLPCEYECRHFYGSDDLCAILTVPDGEEAAYDAQGRKLFDVVWDDIMYLGSGMFCVERDDMDGVVDRQGREVIPCMYWELRCDGGFVIARKDEVLYIMNLQGRVLRTMDEDLCNGWAASAERFIWVEEGLLHIIDQQGNEVW